MEAGLEPVVVFWTRWGIHFMVLLSFAVQVTLLLLADIRRRKDWAWLKVVIWSAYMLADTAAIYALGHMSTLCNWSPEHQLMALWAPLLLVHLGGQDNITAYAMEDNRLWLRHLLILVVQVAAAGYVLYVSNILFDPSELRWAASLMFVVGVLKYGERIWALKRAADSSGLSASSYGEPRRLSDSSANRVVRMTLSSENAKAAELLTLAYSMLDVPKQMFERPTAYVQINNVRDEVRRQEKAEDMLRVVGMQLSMMYDLLYTKAAVVHTWHGLGSRVLISLPCTIIALLLHLSSISHGDKDAAGGHKRSADVLVTIVLLVGAVVVETMSVLRAIFSTWTVLLLYGKEWVTIGNLFFSVIDVVSRAMERLARTESRLSNRMWQHDCTKRRRQQHYSMALGLLGQQDKKEWHSNFYCSLGLGRMRQHSLFKLASHSDYSRGSKMAKMMGVHDWWDSNTYSWSTDVPPRVIEEVLRLLVSRTGQGITESQDWNVLQQRRRRPNDGFSTFWEMTEVLKLEETILVLHIATHAYIQWCINNNNRYLYSIPQMLQQEQQAAEVLANYMFFLLAARPNMLPYPVSRHTYVQLCSDVVTHLRPCTRQTLLSAILKQKEALLEGTPLQPDEDEGIGRRQGNPGETAAAAQSHPQPSMNITLDRGCQLAARLIHDRGVLNKLLQKWVEMLCYTAYWCNENSHAKHLTDGGEIMNAITLLMIYMKNGLIVSEDRHGEGLYGGLI